MLASEATRAKIFGRDVRLAFVEPDQQFRQQLEQSLGDAGIQPDSLLSNPFDEALDSLLRQYANHALLIFIDPFGLAIERTKLLQTIERSSSRQPIDVLYHFSLSTVARMGRAGVTETDTSTHNGRLLDEALGPVDWRKEFTEAAGHGGATRAAMSVAGRFSASVTAESGAASTSIPVRQRPDHLPKYQLILFSKNQQAHWDFADQASLAYVDWLHHCDTVDYQANIQARQASGVLQLIEDPSPERSNVEQLLESEAVRYLSTHVADVIRQHEPLRLIDDIEEVYGKMLGRARVRHLRQAIKSLHADGQINDNGEGDFQNREIRWIE